MAAITAPTSTAATIAIKVRKLTRSTTDILSDADLYDYINTFVIYDIPDHLRMFDNKTAFSFYCEPYVDTYLTDTSLNTANPLYDFKNKYISIDTPLYVAGYNSYLSQSREEFYNQWPLYNSQIQIDTGDGVTTVFTGTLSNVPILRNEVTFSSIGASNVGLVLTDDGAGVLTDPLTGTGSGTINYVTGAYSLTFASAPLLSAAITAQTKPYVASRPTSMLFFDNQFTLRPVPDQPYKITFDAYIRPTYIMDTTNNPKLNDWWQYIAFAASKKIFEDRMDMESVAAIMPALEEQQYNVERKTLVNMNKERAYSIYQEQTSNYGWFPLNNGY